MMRVAIYLFLCAALVALSAAPAAAQVAAPRLTPTPAAIPSRYNLIHFSALDISNAAVSVWGASSIGFGAALSGELTGSPGYSGTFTGGSGRMALVMDHVAFTLSRVDAELNFVPAGPALNFVAKDTQFQLGLRFADWLSLGVGRQTMHTDLSDTGLVDTDVRSRDLPMVGASMRWGSMYFGLASGTDKVRIESEVPSGTTDEAERSVSRWGLAYHSPGPTFSMHAEYYHESRSPFYLAALFPGDGKDKADVNGISLEFVWHNVLFAHESIDQSITNWNAAIPTTHSVTSSRLSVGWVPDGQMGLVLSRSTDEVVTPVDTTRLTTTTMNAVWRF